MFIRRIFIVFVILLAVGVAAPAQIDYAETEEAATKMLLKKDLRQTIAEAEKSPAADLKSLLWRLTLYNRAAYSKKIALTVRQIAAHPDYRKNAYKTNAFLAVALQNAYFFDSKTLWFYLETIEFHEGVYAKFFKLCSEDRTSCDVEAIDRWLAQKALTEERKPAENVWPQFYWDGFQWTSRRLAWREKFGLDRREIENLFLEDVRKNPADLGAAMRYLMVFRTSRDLAWLAENFSTSLASDYFELGDLIGHISLPLASTADSDEPLQIRRVAVRLLLKSLATPFTEKDKQQLAARRFCCASMPSPNPKSINFEKQLRFWTKEKLAEQYQILGEPQNAQPLVEELTKLDKSDISDENPTRLAGAVQASSGARVVESEILRQQATRQDSYEYWRERIDYYDGRNEPELMFSSYMQAFSTVPFEPADRKSVYLRLFQIKRFAEFVDYKFGANANKIVEEDWSDEDKRRYGFWKDAENFLRAEFGKMRADLKYSYELLDEIDDRDFDNLRDEILSKNPEILIDFAKAGLLTDSNSLPDKLLENENIPDSKKDEIFNELIKIADRRDVKSAWFHFEVIYDGQSGKYAPKMRPLLEKHFARSREYVRTYKPTDADGTEYKYLPNKYAEILFQIYLAENNRPAAENLVTSGFYSFHDGLKALLENAVRRGAIDEAMRYWKMTANLDRQNLEALNYLKTFPAMAKSLRDFYTQMKIDEPDSEVPVYALLRLN